MKIKPLSQEERAAFDSWLVEELKKIIPAEEFALIVANPNLATDFYEKYKIVVGLPSLSVRVNGMTVSTFVR